MWLFWKKNGGYLIPKGHLQKNESPQSASLREIKEELNLKVNPKTIAKIGTNNYTFKLPSDNRTHYKKVHLYIYSFLKKEKVSPLKEEGFVKAGWLNFYDALDKITFDKENLLKARKYFYCHQLKKLATKKLN